MLVLINFFDHMGRRLQKTEITQLKLDSFLVVLCLRKKNKVQVSSNYLFIEGKAKAIVYVLTMKYQM